MNDEPRYGLTSNAVDYAWHQLRRRAGLATENGDSIGLEVTRFRLHYASPKEIQPGHGGIVVAPCARGSWQSLLRSEPRSLRWLPTEEVLPDGAHLQITDPIPVLFWGEGFEDGSKPFAELRSDGALVFYADVIAAALFMLSRWEETVISTRDRHDRFPATASTAFKQGFLDRPIVDEYALILRKWLEALIPGWSPEPREFSIKLSHDIDHIYRFQDGYSIGRAILGDLLKRRSLQQAIGSARDVWEQTVTPHNTQYVRAIYHLANLSRKVGITDDAFYFMADGPDPFGAGYDPETSYVRRCIEALGNQGVEVGFHPGYETYLNPTQLAKEKERMDHVLGQTHYGGRQHFLRFRAPDTWRHWEQLGLTYDSTVGYADHEGFRCGTCHPFQPFDLAQDREMAIWEIPLIAMDGTLRNYRSLTPEQGRKQILALAQRCKEVEGTFTLLWHNSSLTESWRVWGDMYQEVLRMLGEM